MFVFSQKNRLCLALCLVLSISVLTGCSQTEKQAIARVDKHDGSVQLRLSANERFIDAQNDTILNIGGAVRTGADGQVDLIYLDDSKISIRSDTYFEIGDEAHLAMQKKGNALYRLAPQEPSANVITPHAVTCVLGTSFLVEVTDEYTKVSVESGKVEVSNFSGSQKQIVRANYQVEVCTEGVVTEPNRINPFVREKLFYERETKMPSINQN